MKKIDINSKLPSDWQCAKCGWVLDFKDLIGYKDSKPCIVFECSNDNCDEEYIAKYKLEGLYSRESFC